MMMILQLSMHTHIQLDDNIIQHTQRRHRILEVELEAALNDEEDDDDDSNAVHTETGSWNGSGIETDDDDDDSTEVSLAANKALSEMQAQLFVAIVTGALESLFKRLYENTENHPHGSGLMFVPRELLIRRATEFLWSIRCAQKHHSQKKSQVTLMFHFSDKFDGTYERILHSQTGKRRRFQVSSNVHAAFQEATTHHRYGRKWAQQSRLKSISKDEGLLGDLIAREEDAHFLGWILAMIDDGTQHIEKTVELSSGYWTIQTLNSSSNLILVCFDASKRSTDDIRLLLNELQCSLNAFFCIDWGHKHQAAEYLLSY